MTRRSLASFRADAPATKAPTWTPPTWADLAYGSVLAVDQSLAALGWAWVTNGPMGLRVNAVGSVMHKPEDFPTSHEGTLTKGVALYYSLLEAWERLNFPEGVEFVHEAPPVGSRMIRPESSLVSAMVVRLAVSINFGNFGGMVYNQHSKSVMTGNANATKKEWHAGIEHFALSQGTQPGNEGERDAVCLALTRLYDHNQEEAL